MANDPNVEEVWLLLNDAFGFAKRCLEINDDADLKKRLVQAFRDESIRTFGVPYREEDGSHGYSGIHVHAGDLCRWIDRQ